MDQKFDLVYLLIDHNYTVETSAVLQSQVLDKIRIQHSVGLNVALITSVEDFDLFNSLVQDGFLSQDIFPEYQSNEFRPIDRGYGCQPERE